ncbi:MAG: 4-hydroxy-tetrahydrodipicolinate reductase, partial [bacterium (Candidatus Ratteibacteria) CG23_combo_of_CG06-09_8_20_14_all_48_7]
TIIFGTTGERLELTHKAGSRQAFARGALKAALFVSQQKAGFYTMSALLNLTSCKP